MKKIILLASLVFVVTSCKKDWTCSCTTTLITNTDTNVSTDSHSITNKTKKVATSECNELDYEHVYSNGNSNTRECSILD